MAYSWIIIKFIDLAINGRLVHNKDFKISIFYQVHVKITKFEYSYRVSIEWVD